MATDIDKETGGNPSSVEIDFAIAQERLATMQTLMIQVEKDMRSLNKHATLCAERWRVHAQEHQDMKSGARMADGGNFIWAAIVGAITFYFK